MLDPRYSTQLNKNCITSRKTNLFGGTFPNRFRVDKRSLYVTESI